MSKKQYTIGVMVGNANSPHTIDTVKGIMSAAKESGVNTINFISVHSSYFYRDYFEREQQEDYDYQSICVFDYDKLCDVDALIVSYGTMSVFMSEKELREFQRRIGGIPTVYLENKIQGPNVRYLVADNYHGIREIMDHLINFHGYEKIVYLSGPMGNLDARERLLGYRDAMAEAGFDVTDDMIEYGDFSEAVTVQVNSILDKNPDAEALVCANDWMAIAAYSVLAERKRLYEQAVKMSDREGIKRYKKHIVGGVGENGIALTGYDNVNDAGNMDPPLSTVVQNPYSNGYTAVKTVISLIENPDKTESILAAPKLITRQSCGCEYGGHLEFPKMIDRYKVQPEQYASTVAEIYTAGLLPAELNSPLSEEVYQAIYNIIIKNTKRYLGLDTEKISSEGILKDIKDFINGDVGNYVPRTIFISTLNDYLMGLIKYAKSSRERDALIEAVSKINEFAYSKLFSETKNSIVMYRHRTWFMPFISRDMANNLDSLKDMYRNAMTKMNVLEVGDTYLFIIDEPVLHRKNDKWVCPDELRLVAYTEGGEITSFEPEDAPIVSKDKLINEYVKGTDDSYCVSLLNIYSGEYQYGIVVAKTTPEDALSLYCASLQISTALKYCEMARAQRRAQNELKHIIKEVEDKNEILRSLSEYDQLTGCYNRRGFLERGLSLIRENTGKEACVVFADLDHLKEINDKYGHSEGDFAIENMAKNMRAALPDSAVLARLGGDEFVAIYLLSEEMNADELVRNITNTSVAFNAMSAKPYYVECSAGYFSFECSDEISLEDVMGRADSYLYEAKARRRKSIVKKFVIK